MKRLYLLWALLLPSLLYARQLSPSEAIVRLQHESNRTTYKHAARRIAQRSNAFHLEHTEQRGDTALIYVMNDSLQGGFCILSADDCAPALLGYAHEGSFQTDSLPDGLRWWLSNLADNIAHAINQQATIERRNTGVHDAIEPLIKTQWRQEAPFNLLCNDVDESSYTGCVATAMAQIMNYHQWPEQGKGSHSYTYSPSPTQSYEISSDFSAHTYQWDKMLLQYGRFGNDRESEDAVALLMRDCGVAVNMSYSNRGSGAASTMAGYALTTYFDYDKGLHNEFRTRYSDEEWEELLISELQAGRPIFYSGTSSRDGGHAFICDGYDGNGYFHFNWGWGGYLDNYFLVTGSDALDSDATEAEGDGFSGSQMICAGIQRPCGGTPQPTSLAMEGGYTLSSNEVARTGYVYLNYDYLTVTSTRPARVLLGMMLQNESNTYYIVNGSNTSSLLDLDKYMRGSVFFMASNVLKNGTYQVYPVFKDMDEPNPEWRLITQEEGTVVPTLTVTGTEPKLCLAAPLSCSSQGEQTPNNWVTHASITIHAELEALQDITDQTIRAAIFPTSLGTSLCSASTTISAKSGDRVPVSFTLSNNALSKLTGSDYIIYIYEGNTLKAPDEKNKLNIHIVDQMPRLADIPRTIDNMKQGNATVQDVQTILVEVLGKTKVRPQ
ncbi:MAG: C10 family peptidase [Bacteroidales bacterium]|nr:C10 family peptidase [Candidatus Physcousia equi]